MVPGCAAEAARSTRSLVSVMAELRLRYVLGAPARAAVRVLLQAALSVRVSRTIRAAARAAAAGGCMLVRTAALRALGGFAAIRGAFIDDCTLRASLKQRGRAHLDRHESLGAEPRALRRSPISGDMVSRTAFTQLRYSTALLLAHAPLLMAARRSSRRVAGICSGVWPLERRAGARRARVAAMARPTCRRCASTACRPLWALTLPVAAHCFSR